MRSEETSIFTCVFKHFVGDNNSDQSAFITVVICIKTYFNISGNSFRHFSQLSIWYFREKKIRKLVQRERLTLPNKLFIAGYDATEFKTSSKMAAIWQPPFWNPFQDKKIGFILAAIVSEFDLKRPNDSEDFQKYFIELT